jgi:hypothetical protein
MRRIEFVSFLAGLACLAGAFAAGKACWDARDAGDKLALVAAGGFLVAGVILLVYAVPMRDPLGLEPARLWENRKGPQ